MRAAALLVDESDALTNAAAPALRNLRGPTAPLAVRLAAALLKYVESTQLVNDLTYRNSSGKTTAHRTSHRSKTP